MITCTIEDCNRPVHVKSRGLCQRHYHRLKATGTTDLPPRPTAPPIIACAVDGCDEAVFVRKAGLCRLHYARQWRNGDPLVVKGSGRQVCSVEGCESFCRSHGYCGKHYDRVQRYGSTELPAGRLVAPTVVPATGCSVGGCGRDVYVKKHGLCQLHYARLARHGDPLAWVKPVRKVCSVSDCAHPSVLHGLCSLHNARVKRYGSTDLPVRPILPTICTMDDCTLQVQAHGLCEMHYRRARRTGAPDNRQCRQCGNDVMGHQRNVFCSKECKEAWAYWNRQEKHRTNWLKRYDLTVEEYDKLLADQGGACAVCRKTEPGSRGWCVDHCHDTGRVRGILCMTCNAGIGHLGDSPAMLRAAAAYLEK